MTFPMPRFGRADTLDPRAHFAAPHSLSPVERQVVLLARRDRLASLLPRRAPVVRLLRLMGATPANPLADPRLEALRRYAVMLHRAGDLAAAPARRTLARIGFTEAQIRHARWLARLTAASSASPAGSAVGTGRS